MRRISRDSNKFVAGIKLPNHKRSYILIATFFMVAVSATSLNNLLSRSSELNLSLSINTGLIDENQQNKIAALIKFVARNEFVTNKSTDLSSVKQPLANRLVATNRNLQAIVGDISQSKGRESLNFLNELWRRAGDLQAPDEALIAMQQVAMSGDDTLANKAQFAYNDLLKYRSALEKEKQQKTGVLTLPSSQIDSTNKTHQQEHPLSVENKYEKVMKNIESKLYSSSHQSRSIAVDTLNLLRTPAALSLLIQVANRELDATIRYKALRGIWMLTADRVNVDTDFGNNAAGIDVLYNAKYDQNQRISTLASTALDDLNKQLNFEN